MTAYENFVFDSAGETVAVTPATPQEVWAEQVFQFLDVLKHSMEQFDDVPDDEGDLGDGSVYVDGWYDASEHLNMRFKEVFGVIVN